MFAEDCTRLNASVLLARSRGIDLETDDHEWHVAIHVPYEDCRGQHVQIVPLFITSTPQPFGGRRWWWRCPVCRQPRGVLFMDSSYDRVACRRCGGVRYLAAYPGRQRHREHMDTLRWVVFGFPTQSRPDVDAVLAPRRRGIRRGRRVLQRAARASLRAMADAEHTIAAVRSLKREYELPRAIPYVSV